MNDTSRAIWTIKMDTITPNTDQKMMSAAAV